MYAPRNTTSSKKAGSADSRRVLSASLHSPSLGKKSLYVPSSTLTFTAELNPSSLILKVRERARARGAAPRPAAVGTAWRFVQRLLVPCVAFHNTDIGDDPAYRTQAPK